MKTQEWCERLEFVKDFYMRHPLLKLPYSVDEKGKVLIFFYDNNPDKMAFVSFVRALGAVKKEYTESSIIVEGLGFKLLMDRGAVCKPKRMEKKTIPAQPAKEAYEVDVVAEWDCGSIFETELPAGDPLRELEAVPSMLTSRKDDIPF